MGYEVVNDIIIGYASILIASPLDPKKKRTDTYLERIKSIEVLKPKKKDVMPVASTLVTFAVSPKLTRKSSAKKKPEANLPKVF